MSDVEGRVAELRAELELAELEAEFVKAKASKAGAPRDLKDQVRAARQHYRDLAYGKGGH